MKALATTALQTPRLIGEPLGPEHGDLLTEMMLDPRVYRTLWPWAHAPTEADIRHGLIDKRDHWERHGFGLWLLRDRATGELAGRGGLQYTDAIGGYEVEAAWAIVPDRWGRGLATELAQGAVATAFGQLELPEVIAISLPENRASRRVMEKVGFEFERDIVHAGLPHVLYRHLPPPRGR